MSSPIDPDDVDWEVVRELVCLTCVASGSIKPSAVRALAILPRDEQIARNHARHLLIVADVFTVKGV